MFQQIPAPVFQRMRYLEQVDERDRRDGTPPAKRLRQIAPETGPFIALLAAAAPDGAFLEIGTSAGYSALWLSLACKERGTILTTFEVLPHKAELARETFRLSGVDEVVKLVQGDAREQIGAHEAIGFCFLDAEKEIYGECYEAVIPRLVRGGLLVADNAISHREELQPMLERALADDRADALIVPIGRGELVCRRR